ncbi:MAG TPA: choice-of-anchor Q domain-containing protein [Herpetosiphonaceae bacterium]
MLEMYIVTPQRGVSRPQGARCDIGAFERESTPTLTPRARLPLIAW